MKSLRKIKIIGCILFLVVLSTSANAERPAVVLAFDDGWTSQYYKAFPIMQANNQKGTDFVITGEIAGATGQEGLEYMNLSQLTKLYAAGWDLSSHTVTHPFLTQLSTTAMNTELSVSKTWLNNAKFTRGSMFLAYPYGDYNINVITAIENNGYLAARTICGSDPSNWCYANLTAYPRYNVTSPDRYEMITLLADGYASKTDSWTTTPAYIKNEINNTINSNGFLIITFHEIVDTVPGYNEEYNTLDFKIVSDYLKSRSADIDVVTLSDFFNSAPTPSITVTVPNGGENWQPGTIQTIKWIYTGSPGSYVKVELLKGTVVNSTINSNVSIGSNGSGSYNWMINSTQTPGTDYKVKITSTSTPAYNDTSNNNFTISAPTGIYKNVKCDNKEIDKDKKKFDDDNKKLNDDNKKLNDDTVKKVDAKTIASDKKKVEDDLKKVKDDLKKVNDDNKCKTTIKA
jgi:peptidoglycan/xylan/chitin deacetylase (PgdA/CDA1 family)